MANLQLGSIVYGVTLEDKYEVIRELGSGAFGKVYLVKNKADGSSVALKTIDTGLLDNRESKALKNEGQLAIGIQHPNVVHIFYFHDGQTYQNLPPYMLMEYVPGGTLHEVLRGRTGNNFFSSDEMFNIFHQLAAGMQAINERLVHRDIKPDNILVANGVYKISDFGLSKIVGAATRTETFKRIAHIMYRSPEGWRSEDNLPHMDMYSMGIVFFQIATLGLPYQISDRGDAVDNWRTAHLFQQPLDPSTLNHALDIEVSQIIIKMISKRPGERYQSWGELIQRLERVKSAPATLGGITSLLRRDMENRRREELQDLDSQRNSRIQEENEGFIEYSFNQIQQNASQIVENFNASSEFTKLKIEKQSRFSIIITKDSDQNQAGVIIQVEINKQEQGFPSGMTVFNTSLVKAVGIVRAPSGYGFNLVLVSTRQDDLYGEWQVQYKNTVYPDPRNLQNQKMTPYEISELLSHRNIGFSGGLMRQGEIFDPKLLIPLLEELL